MTRKRVLFKNILFKAFLHFIHIRIEKEVNKKQMTETCTHIYISIHTDNIFKMHNDKENKN